MNKISRFLKTSIVYMLGSVFSRLISIFMLPLYTNKIRPEQFGSYDLVITLMSFIAPIAFFQIWDGMLRYAFDYHDENEKYAVIDNSFAVMIIGLFLYSLLFFVINQKFSFDHDFIVYIYGIVVAINYYYTFISRVFLNNKLYIVSGILNAFFTALFNIIFILGFKLDIISLYMSTIIGLLLQITIIEIKIKPFGRLSCSRIKIHLILKMLKFSIPLCFASVSYWLLSGFTKVVITNNLGNYENGLYSVANKFASIIVLGVSVFQFAWNEMAYILSGDEDRFKSFDYAINMVFKIVVLFSGFFILFIKLIFPFYIGYEYQGALNLIPVAIIGVSMNSFAGFLGTIFSSEKNTKWVLWSTIFPALLNVLLAPVMTKYLGIQGTISALAISFSTIAIMRLIILHKQYKIILSKRMVFYLAIFAFSCYLFFALNGTAIIVLCLSIYIAYLLYEFHDLIGKVFIFIKER